MQPQYLKLTNFNIRVEMIVFNKQLMKWKLKHHACLNCQKVRNLKIHSHSMIEMSASILMKYLNRWRGVIHQRMQHLIGLIL
jgi:hypothetical protein